MLYPSTKRPDEHHGTQPGYPIEHLDLYRTYSAGLHEISIVHGKGSGTLRNAVRRYLKGNRLVKSFRQGYEWEGGSGVTIVELALK